MPAWLISTLVHAAVLLVLALMTLRSVESPGGLLRLNVSSERTQDAAELQQATLRLAAAVDSLQVPVSASDALFTKSELEPLDLELRLPSRTSLTDALRADGALAADGSALPETPLDGIASFFGTQAQGEKFVFVVDNSNSMGGGRFETALEELLKTVDQLTPQQSFHVMFFSDSEYLMFYPKPTQRLLPATERNKDRLRAWLYTVELCLRTDGRDAVQRALRMNPDAIYILGDGAFTDNTTATYTATHRRKVPIHTLGMEVDRRGAGQLQAIAAANQGTYQSVSASNSARQTARQNPIPKHWSREGIWGKELPRRPKRR